MLALLAGVEPQASGWDMCSPTDDAITALAHQLRADGQGMPRGDYSLVPAAQDLITSRAEGLHKHERRAETEA